MPDDPQNAPLDLSFYPISDEHKSHDFDVGEHGFLTSFIRKDALKHHRMFRSRVRIGTDDGENIRSFYSLQMQAEPVQGAVGEHKNKTGKYPSHFPCLQIAHFGVQQKFQRPREKSEGVRHRLGEQTLTDAIITAGDVLRNCGAYALHLSAVDEAAELFFENYGFVRYTDGKERKMLMPAVDVVTSTEAWENEQGERLFGDVDGYSELIEMT